MRGLAHPCKSIHHNNVPIEILYISMEISKAQLIKSKDIYANLKGQSYKIFWWNLFNVEVLTNLSKKKWFHSSNPSHNKEVLKVWQYWISEEYTFSDIIVSSFSSSNICWFSDFSSSENWLNLSNLQSILSSSNSLFYYLRLIYPH